MALSFGQAKVIFEKRGRPRHYGVKRRGGVAGGKVEVKDVDIKKVAAMMPHRRDLPVDVRHDQKGESVIGRLRLNNQITFEQYEAAQKLQQIVRRYRQVIDAPKSSPSGVQLGGITGPGPRMIEDDAARKRAADHKSVTNRMIAELGLSVSRMVMRVVVFDEPLPKEQNALFQLRTALTLLASHLGLTRTSGALSGR